MLYRIVRPLARLVLMANFKKIYFHRADLIPRDKPVILAANHPSAFIEPCLLACFQHRSLYFLARGDLFIKPIYIRLLNSLHIVPIFRLKDGGYQKLRNNYDTFAFCHQTLSEKKAILILAEGSTRHEKRLRPLRKGTSRIAFGTLDKYPDLDLQIVPVGVNYTHADRFRSSVMLSFAPPISVQEYYEQHTVQPVKASQQLLDKIKGDLVERMIIIREKADEPLVESLFLLHRNNHPPVDFPIFEQGDQALRAEQQIANFVNELPEAEKRPIAEKVERYFSVLEEKGLADQSAEQQQRVRSDLFFLVGYLPATLGHWLNCPPALLIQRIVDDRVRAVEFKRSVALALGLVLYGLYWLFWLIISSLYFGPVALMVLMLGPVLGYFSLLYWEKYADWRLKRAWKALDEKTAHKLREERKDLIALLARI
ncbi:MAG: 1-acyl-sn-glycerol-3-phosphate acyltransferase [Bacteroidota bacterium]